MFIVTLCIIAKAWEYPECRPECIKKMHCVYVQWNIIQPQKKEITIFVTTWMKLDGIMLSEMSHLEKNKYYIISLICGILKKKRLIGKETTLVVARGRGGWRRGKQVKVVKSYKPSIIIKFWGCNIQYGDYNTSVLYIHLPEE